MSLALHDTAYRWLSADDATPPTALREVDDRLRADTALQLAAHRTGLLWTGDYRNARQLLAALGRRLPRTPGKPGRPRRTPAEEFLAGRRATARRACRLAMLLVPLDPGFVVPLPHAPDVRAACAEVYPPLDGPAVLALRELLGVLGAHQWRVRGIEVPALGGRIHPHYGVYPPTRHEYVDLVATAPLPDRTAAIDVGTGTGVLAALLARRGVAHVLATDIDQHSVDCARANVRDLGLTGQVEVRLTDLFPPGRAPLVVCNPPWLPAAAHTRLDRAVYDPGSRMLRGFLTGLAAHLEPAGEGWLVLSDLAERLGLRSRDTLLGMIEDAGLRVLDRSDSRPRHARAADADDPLHTARAAELTSLWRLGAR